ncbi:MAG: FHA domain-containing protein [Chloroflexota bacterium]
MSDVSKFIMVVILLFGFIWLVRAGWSRSLAWVLQQVQQLRLTGWQQHFWPMLTRFTGPVGALLFYVFVDQSQGEDIQLSNPIWPGKPKKWDEVTDHGDRTIAPESNLCLVVTKSRATKGPNMGKRYALAEGINALGRDPITEPQTQLISIRGDDSISGSHLYLEIADDGSCQVTDRQSRFGTRLNGRRLAVEQTAPLQLGDKIHIGNTTLQLSLEEDAPQPTAMEPDQSSFAFQVIKGKEAGKRWLLTQKLALIGRSKECQWHLSDTQISRKHAEIRREGSQVKIKDLQSSHGLFVNGHKYDTRTLEVGDLIRLGNTELKFEQV